MLDYENKFCPISTYIRENNLSSVITYNRLLKLALAANLEYKRIGIQQQYRFKNLGSIEITEKDIKVKIQARVPEVDPLSEGYVYLLKLYESNGNLLNICKFGISANVESRVQSLNNKIKHTGFYYSSHCVSKLLGNPVEYETTILKYCRLRGTPIREDKYGSVREVFIYEEWMDNLIPQSKEEQ